MPQSTASTQNTFLDALRSEIAAGNDNLSSWVKFIHKSGNIDSLFTLETWLKGLRSFLNIDHVPLSESEKDNLLTRNFISELNIAQYAVRICEYHACNILSVGETGVFEIEKIIENQIRKDRILDTHIGRYLEQITPDDSIMKLIDSLNDFRLCIHSYQRLPNPGYQLYLAIGRTYRQELKGCRYIDMLLNQRFRIQYDMIESKSLTESLRSIKDEQMRRNSALALLYLYRLIKYLNLIHEDLINDRSLKHNLVLFSMIHEEMENLSNFLKTRFLKVNHSGKKLRQIAEMAAYSLKTESRKVISRELVGISRETDPTKIYVRIENSHGILLNCCQSNIMGLVQAIDKDFREENIFPKRKERIAEADTIRHTLWDLRKWLMQITETESVPDTKEILDRITSFRETHPHSLMYKDWIEFENFMEILTVSSDVNEILQYLRKFLDFIEDLIQEVSKRGKYQVNVKI